MTDPKEIFAPRSDDLGQAPDAGKPGVSVIVPVYNCAGSLPRCIESALSQDPAPSEVIVVNDGSTDNVREVAAGYGNRIVYLEQANQGQGAARNAGLRVASGRYVAFLDSDDYWLPGFIRACVSFLEAHPEAIAVSTGQRIKTWGK